MGPRIGVTVARKGLFRVFFLSVAMGVASTGGVGCESTSSKIGTCGDASCAGAGGDDAQPPGGSSGSGGGGGAPAGANGSGAAPLSGGRASEGGGGATGGEPPTDVTDSGAANGGEAPSTRGSNGGGANGGEPPTEGGNSGAANGGALPSEGGADTGVVDSCPPNYKKCDDKCVNVSDPTYGCGETTCDATSCPDTENGTLVCRNGACVVGSCGSGTKKCGDKCVTTDANNGCADPARCTACARNETCEGSPTACQCVPRPMATACSGKSCGSVSNGCGGTYSCGSCSGAEPVCVSGACEQCSTVSDCPSGTFNCSNNTCVCRIPSSANGLKDGGFDSASALNGWAPVDATWNTSDADGCPQSGSVSLNGQITKCFSNAVAGAQYALGFRYRQAEDSGSGCYGMYHQDRNCTVPSGTAEFINAGAATASASWTTSFATGTAPENTLSILVVCSGGGGTIMDQIYLRTPVTTGAGF